MNEQASTTSEKTAWKGRYKCYSIEHVEGLFEFQFYQGMINDQTLIKYEKQTKECLGPIKVFIKVQTPDTGRDDTVICLFTLYDYSTENEKNFCVKACINIDDPYKSYIENRLASTFTDILRKDVQIQYLDEPGEVIVLNDKLLKSLE